MKSAFDLLAEGNSETMLHLLDVASKGNNLSTKIDGAPAIVMWSEFPGLKGPGVSFKLIIQQTQKGNPGAYFTSDEEIDKFFAEKDLGEGIKAHRIAAFKHALQVAKTVKPGIMLWGDTFFSDSSELTEVDGNPACTPNTLEYVFTKPEWVEKINGSNFGIFIHTKVSKSFAISRVSDVSELVDKNSEFILDPDDIEPKMKKYSTSGSITKIKQMITDIPSLEDPKFQKMLRKALKTKDFSILGEDAQSVANLCAEISKTLNAITDQIGLSGFYTRYNGKESGGEGFVVSDGSESMKLLTDDFTDKNLLHIHSLKESITALSNIISEMRRSL